MLNKHFLGSICKFTHPSFSLPAYDARYQTNTKFNTQGLLCHNCHERGHKATHCPHLPNQQPTLAVTQVKPWNQPTPIDINLATQDKKNLSEVTCYKVYLNF